MKTPPAHPGRPEHAGTYDIRLRGHLDQHWTRALEVPDLTHEDDGTTVLRGVTADQAALHGLLQRIRDLGVPLISVIFTPAKPSD
jgi:hypothetical protein